jgi:DNA helicase HerA-like ATPase
VSIFADELALLAGSSAEVVSWLRDQGRAFGVCVVFGTQRPDQVDFEVRQAMLSMETLIAFAQSSPDVINAIVGDLSLDGTEWSNTDIAQLPQYTAAVRTSGPGGRLPSLVVRMDYFEGDMAAFAAQQGYTDGDPVPAAVGA